MGTQSCKLLKLAKAHNRSTARLFKSFHIPLIFTYFHVGTTNVIVFYLINHRKVEKDALMACMKSLVWWKTNTARWPKHTSLTGTHVGGSIILWGGFSSVGGKRSRSEWIWRITLEKKGIKNQLMFLKIDLPRVWGIFQFFWQNNCSKCSQCNDSKKIF